MITINGKGIFNFTINFSQHSLTLFDAQLTGDLGVSVGDIVTLDFEDKLSTSLKMEVLSYADFDGLRWHIKCIGYGGTQLLKTPTPTFIQNPTSTKIISSVYSYSNFTISTYPTLTQSNIVIPGSISSFNILSRYFGDCRQDMSGNLVLGKPQNNLNSGRFSIEDYNESKKTIDLSMNYGDVVINSGDIIFKQSIVENITYYGSMDDFRCKVKLTFDSLQPQIF
jgi:hypothetical protein